MSDDNTPLGTRKEPDRQDTPAPDRDRTDATADDGERRDAHDQRDAQDQPRVIDNRLAGGRYRNAIQAGTIDRLTVHEVFASRRVVLAVAAAAVTVVAGAVGALSYFGGSPEPAAGREPRAAHAQLAPSTPGASASGRVVSERPPAEQGAVPSMPPLSDSADQGGNRNRNAPGGTDAASDAGPGAGERPESGPRPARADTKAPFEEYEPAPSPGPEVVDGPKCGPYDLCAYRSPNHQHRYDFRAPDSATFGTCFSLPAGDPGFVAVVNGRGYSYRVYEKPRCTGDSKVVGVGDGYQDLPFAFRSYTKA